MRTINDDSLQEKHNVPLDQVQEVLNRMRRAEITTYARPSSGSLEPFTGYWREQIVEWMYTLVKYCKLRHESVSAASYFLDTSVSRGVVVTSLDYQIGAMAALYLGLKIFDSPSMRVVKLSSLVKLGSGEFQEEDVIEMEKKMLQALGWRMNPPTPGCFVHQYMRLLPLESDSLKESLQREAFRSIETCISNDYFCSIIPSVQGYAALLLAIDQHLASQVALSKQQRKGNNMLTSWQVQTFLSRMNKIAQLDHTDITICQTTDLLSRTVQHSEMLPETIGHESLRTSVSLTGAKDSPSAAMSPNNVFLQ